jgi:putative N6-adenine-specific DNA methylase
VQSKMFTNTQFPLLLAKDAIVDDFRARTGDRPNVDLKNAQVVLDLFINENHCIISMNTSGDPLFKRGYRKEAGLAPLNEVAAAGMIYLSGWDRKSTLLDPMCGSGTIAIEAAMIASNTPAGMLREEFTFMHLKNFDRVTWEKVVEEGQRHIQPVACKIFASDLSEVMITKTRRNIRTLPFARTIDLQVSDFKDLKKPDSAGVVICNPPYGERIGENVEAMYKDFGDWMKQNMSGFSCWILSSNQDAIKSIGLKANRTIKMFNGSLPCDFKRYDIFDGSKKHTHKDA